MNYLIAICVAGLVCTGCATTAPPQPPKRIVQSPADGLRELDIVARALPPIGNVLPIQLAVTNLTLKPLTLDPQGIQADRALGASVAVLPAADAEQAAGGADQLVKALTRQNLVHVAIHQPPVSQAQDELGASVGCLFLPGGAGILVCPLMWTVALADRTAVAVSPDMQVKDIALRDGELTPGLEAWGYVFLPRANYTGIEVPVKSDMGGTEIIAQPWDSAADLTASNQSAPPHEDTASRDGQAESPIAAGLSDSTSGGASEQSRKSAR